MQYCGSLGHPSEENTGLIYMRARYYDPATGRFISQDPGKNGGNWFAYANGNPVRLADMDGRQAGDYLGDAATAATIILGARLYAERVLGWKPGASVDDMVNAIAFANYAVAAGKATFLAMTAEEIDDGDPDALFGRGMAMAVGAAVTGVCVVAAEQQVGLAMIMDEWNLD